MIKHIKRRPLAYKVRSKLVRTSKRRYRLDGLNTLKYHLLNITHCYLYTNILVDVGAPPKTIQDFQREYEQSQNVSRRHWNCSVIETVIMSILIFVNKFYILVVWFYINPKCLNFNSLWAQTPWKSQTDNCCGFYLFWQCRPLPKKNSMYLWRANNRFHSLFPNR